MHIFCGNNFFPKSQLDFENWTFLKMSENENPKKVSKTTHFSLLDHYGLSCFFKIAKFVMLIFSRFIAEHLGVFLI